MSDLNRIGQQAKKASRVLNGLGRKEKDRALLYAAELLLQRQEKILTANEQDVKRAEENGMKEALIDRLSLNEGRLEVIAEGMRQVAALPDPVGMVSEMSLRPNGLQIGKRRVPLGVVGIIYEARPNVTADAFALCFKSGNAAILRGGSDAFQSNLAITEVLREALQDCGLPMDAVQCLMDTSRETASAFMRLHQYVDVLIPRGGAGLIRSVVENSTIPVIETGTGNCHIYVDEYADLTKVMPIIINAKTQRLGVCNAAESLLVHSGVMESFLPMLAEAMKEHRVEVRADERACAIIPDFIRAEEEDWGKEYLDRIISLKTVDSLEEAIDHINQYNTKHSDAIITEHYGHAQQFLRDVDAAAVYVNASTRFTDGYEFGYGAEIGISTQKLHARGPMGLKELTCEKYIIYGDGQIRE